MKNLLPFILTVALLLAGIAYWVLSLAQRIVGRI